MWNHPGQQKLAFEISLNTKNQHDIYFFEDQKDRSHQV